MDQEKHSLRKRYFYMLYKCIVIQIILTFYYKIFSFTRSICKIAKGCAATALAAQCYGNLDFDTAHGFFVIPVIENEEEYDHIDEIFCDTSK